jgi:hypothetical protein
MPEMEMGDGAFSGSDVGENTGVVRALDAVDEMLEDEDVLRRDDSSEPKDDARELGVSDRDDGEDEASDVAGLALRCATLACLGVRFGRRAIFLRVVLSFETGVNVAGREDGLRGWEG